MDNIYNYKRNIKLKLLKDILFQLSEYNSIIGYNNQKAFNLIIDEKEAENKEKKLYNIYIKRGQNNPRKIFNLDIVLDKEDYSTLNNFFDEIIKSDFFLYTSFTNDLIKDNCSYNINLKNGVEITFLLKSIDSIKTARETEKQFKEKRIIKSSEKAEIRDKDEIQEEKLNKTIDIIDNIIMLADEYNNITGYNSIKPFTFVINNHYNRIEECYTCNFNIYRGTVGIDLVLILKASIKDKNVLYNALEELINRIKSNTNYKYDILEETNYQDIYTLVLNKFIKIRFEINNNLDKSFFEKINTENKVKVLKKQL